MSLNVSAIFPASPVQFPGSRTEKSPSRMVCRLARITLRSADTGSVSASVTARPLLFALGLGSGIVGVLVLLGSVRFIPLSTVEGRRAPPISRLLAQLADISLDYAT